MWGEKWAKIETRDICRDSRMGFGCAATTPAWEHTELWKELEVKKGGPLRLGFPSALPLAHSLTLGESLTQPNLSCSICKIK